MATEKRLIRADVTVDAFTKWLTSTYDGRMPVDIVNEIPTVDAVEVVHGRWEEHPKDTFAKEHRCDKLRCTKCFHFFYHNYGDGKQYCPTCGAKMDGG